MGKVIVIALAFVVFWWLLMRYKPTLPRRPSTPPAPEDMVRCVHCGVHLPRSESRSSDGNFFCSEEHMRLHA